MAALGIAVVRAAFARARDERTATHRWKEARCDGALDHRAFHAAAVTCHAIVAGTTDGPAAAVALAVADRSVARLARCCFGLCCCCCAHLATFSLVQRDELIQMCDSGKFELLPLLLPLLL